MIETFEDLYVFINKTTQALSLMAVTTQHPPNPNKCVLTRIKSAVSAAVHSHNLSLVILFQSIKTAGGTLAAFIGHVHSADMVEDIEYFNFVIHLVYMRWSNSNYSI